MLCSFTWTPGSATSATFKIRGFVKWLGGPDTCVRSQLLAQTKIAWDLQTQVDLTKSAKNDLPVLKSALEDHYQPYNRGWLRARLRPVDSGSPDPCMCHPD